MSERRGALLGQGDDAPGFAFKISPIKEGGLLAAAIGVIFCGYVIGPRYIERVCSPCDKTTINRFDREAVQWHSRLLEALSYVMEVGAIATPALLAIRDRGLSRELAEDMWVYAETLALGSALNITIKTVVQRPIPQLYTGLNPALEKKPSGYRSFYSGHTAELTGALVASAVMSHLRGHKRAWPWALAAAGAAAVSVARVGAGRHFYSDVAAGAMAGGVVGSLVPLLHPARQTTTPKATGSSTAVPCHFLDRLSARCNFANRSETISAREGVAQPGTPMPSETRPSSTRSRFTSRLTSSSIWECLR